MNRKCDKCGNSFEPMQTETMCMFCMTTPISPTELDKAIEKAEQAKGLCAKDRTKGVWTDCITADVADSLLLAAKRLKEVEKERDELKFLLENANEAISLKSPEFEGSSVFVRVYQEQYKQLSTLRTSLKRCAVALNSWTVHLKDKQNHDSILAVYAAEQAISDPLVQAALKDQ